MLATRYKLVTVGPPVALATARPGKLLGTTTAVPRVVHVAGVAKAAALGACYVVPNEIICGTLARSLGLPVPPGCLVMTEDTPERLGTLHYVSLDFNLGGRPLAPADVPAFVAHDESLASALVVFDAWVLNGDRHAHNIFFDPATTQTVIFDYGDALFGTQPRGVRHLEAQRGRLNVAKHVVPPHLTRLGGLKRGIERVQALPRFVVEDAVAAAVGAGLTEEEATLGADFLVERAQRLPELLKREQARFTRIRPEAWETF